MRKVPQENNSKSRNALPAGYELLWYQIKSVLGQGAFGITYLAQDINLDRLVAIKEKKILLFGAMTGAGVLRDQKYHDYVLNYRASYAQETAEMVSGLIKMGIKPEEIAFFTQRDSYGQSGFQGAADALKKNGFEHPETLAHGRYTRNSLNVEDAVAALLDQEITPKAVIMVGSYAPAAKFIQLAKQELPELIFLNVSFVGSNALVTALGDQAEGIIITEVVPDYSSELPLAKEYRDALTRYSKNIEPGFVSFEGYIVAKIFVEGLQISGENFDQHSLSKSIRTLNNLDIGLGVNISFKEGSNQAINTIWPMIYQDKKFRPFNWTTSTSKIVDQKQLGHVSQ